MRVLVGFVVVTLLLTFGAIVVAERNTPKYQNGVEYTVKHNEIGCTQYRYNNDFYWRCPDKTITEINQTESYQCGKSRCTRTISEPVTN